MSELLILFIFVTFPEYFYEAESIAGNHLALDNSPFSLFHNPSLLPDETSFFSNYANPFMIEGLNFGELAGVWRGIAGGIQFFGEDIYKEISIAAGKKFNITRLQLGIAVRSNLLFIEGFAPEKNWDIDFGLNYKLVEIFQVATAIRGIYTIIRRTEEETSPSMDISLKFLESTSSASFLDLYLEEGFSYSLRISQRIKITSILNVAFGISTEPKIYSFGLGVTKPVEINYTFREHAWLGGTHSISLGYR